MRSNFSTKYNQIPILWGIDKDLVFYIIRRYEKLYIQELENLKTEGMKLPKYFKDIRTDEEYIYDIIDGWLMEDIICDAWLRPRLIEINSNIEIKVMGTNRDRVIQKYNPYSITTNPDLIFTLNGSETKIELQMARRILNNGYDMKEAKVNRAIENGTYFLWILIPTNEYFIINTKKEIINITPAPNPSWGGKSVYHIDYNFINRIGGLGNMKSKLNDFYLTKLGLK
jgi:hypothetical protein